MSKQSPTIYKNFLSFIDKSYFSHLVGQHNSDKYAKEFSSRELLISVLVCQIRWLTSIRELQTELCVQSDLRDDWKLGSFCRSTFSYWINKTDPIVFQELFYHMLNKIQRILPGDTKSSSSKTPVIYSIDSTIIPLCLSLFDWAYYRKKKWATKIHTRMNNDSWLPDLVLITNGKVADMTACYKMLEGIKRWDILLMDRGYLDYSLLKLICDKGIIFVTRTKKSTSYCPIGDIPITDSRVLYDKKVEFLSTNSYEKCPETLRVIRYYDEKNEKIVEFITNNLDLQATMIAELYRRRREIETLFKRLKENLVIKEFLWTSMNAVQNQIRIALIYYLVLYYIKLQTKAKESLTTLARKLDALLYRRTDILVFIWTSVNRVHKALAPPGKGLFENMFV